MKKGQGQPNSEVGSIARKLESLLLKPKLLLRNIYRREENSNMMHSYSDTVSLSSVQSSDDSDWTICDNQTCSDECVEVPEEFKVREFPASSLFMMQGNSERSSTPTRSHMRTRSNGPLPDAMEGQNERFYHVFKQGEIAELVNKRVKGLSLKSCVYDSGHWYATLVKQEKPSTLT